MKSPQGASPVRQDLGAQSEIPEQGVQPPVRFSRYAVGMLLTISVVNFMDRQFLNILSEPIKRELHLADWQLGMLSGSAFVVLYALVALPIAGFADRGNRPLIISASLVVWSSFTALCGSAHSFLQLALYRLGVGAGEAGSGPPSLSLIADFTPRENRASALAFYAMGAPLGGLLGKSLGGLIGATWGWRVAFLVAGLPGVVLAVIAAVTLRETRAKMSAAAARLRDKQSPLIDAIRLLARKPTFWLVAFGAAMQNLVAYGYGPFLAPFYLRNHTFEIAAMAAHAGMKSLGLLGLAIGLINGICGCASALAGGWIADRAAARHVKWVLIAPTFAVLGAVPAYILAFTVSSAPVSLALLIIPHLLNALWFGPVYAVSQGVVPVRVRATASAVLLFITTVIGQGFGALGVGIMSDAFATMLHLGEANGLRWAMIAGSFVSLISLGLFWFAGRTVSSDMES